MLINSGFHSDLAAELIKSKIVPELSSCSVERREYTFGKSRIDFLLTPDTSVKEGSENESKHPPQVKMLLEGRVALW